jgi:hypothetical protein
VLKYVEENNNMFEASIVFDINYNTVRNWYKAYTEENRLEPKEADGVLLHPSSRTL